MPRVSSLPPADTTVVVDSVVGQVGGPVFNVAYYLSALGLRTRLVAPYGERDREVVEDALSASHLDAIGLIPIPGDTDRLFAFLTNQHHYSFYVRAPISDEVQREYLERAVGSAWVVLTGSRHRATRKAFVELARTFEGDWLAFNPSYAIYEYESSELRHLLNRTHLVLFNEQEASHAFRLLGLMAERDLSSVVSGTMIVTLGSKGGRVYNAGQSAEFDSFGSSKRNAIGAGDAFFAGVLFEKFRGASMSEAVDFGKALASRIIECAEVRVVISESQIREALTKFTGRPTDRLRVDR
jgi:sugar/nucleoside kinase (ribokinase family)